MTTISSFNSAIPAPRAVYVAFEVFPRPKGASSHIAAMVTALARRFKPVWLLCGGFADMPALQIEDGLIILRHRLHHPNLLKRALDFGRFVQERLTPENIRPELLVFRDPWGGGPALNARPDVAAVFEVNALPSWELPYAYPALIRNPAIRAKTQDLERFCLAAARRLITVSPVTKTALIDLGVEAERVDVVPNAAGPDFFLADPGRAGLDYLAGGRWFGYFGSLHPWQGVDLLVRAWAAVAESWPEVRLLIVHNGRRGWLKSLKKLIVKTDLADRIALRSPLPPVQLAGVLTRLEFTCAPLLATPRNTIQGCCPIKIVESMAAGTPVLAADLRVTRELITPGRDGLLVPPGEVRAWALALNHLLADPERRNKLAAGARATARERFDPEIMATKLDRVWNSALGRAGAA